MGPARKEEMSEFDARLSECLEALIEGRWDLDECLRRYPEHAGALRPMLETAIAASQAHALEPRPEFASAARERFLVASGQRLQQAMDVEPEPAFFAAARVRFLMRAQKMKLAERAKAPRRIPVFGSPFGALATGMAAIVVFLGFSTYTVATASAALPGDWQYPVKLQTERVRLALAFSDDSKRDIKLDIAEERVHEIEVLSNRGDIIGPGTLDRLVEQTKPLVDDVQTGDWDTSDATRLQEIARKQRRVLKDAEAQAQVAPDAAPQLKAAEDVSKQGVAATTSVLFNDPARPPVIVTPAVEVTPTQTDVPAIIVAPSSTPTRQATPADGEPSATATAAVPTEVTIPSEGDDIAINPQPAAERGGVKYLELQAGRLRMLVPSSDSGWYLDSSMDPVSPTLLKFARVDGSSFFVVSKLTGDLYWFVQHNGSLDQVQMRITQNGAVFVADPEVVSAAYGAQADVPLYIVNTIRILPEPTPEPSPTHTPSPTATPTPPAAP
jgi:hypothetical protein